jgi:hypothetical protein
VKTRFYPALRAVEHATGLAGVRPLRLFPVLWPLWRVETAASFYDERAYEVIDRFLVLAIRDAGIRTAEELAAFYGVPVPLVQRCARFLAAIGHVQVDNGTVTLTDLGRRSADDDTRYEPRQSRQDIFVEQFTAQPLRRAYYDGSVPIFDSHELPADRLSDRSRFQPLYAGAQFRDEMVLPLRGREDRAEYNLPRMLRDLQVIGSRPAFLPAYVIETADTGLLVYTPLAPERDAFFERVARSAPVLAGLIRAEQSPDPRQIWTDWLAEGRGGLGTFSQLPNGVWRAILRPDAFGPGAKLPLSRVGSYELRKRHFLQLWCEDVALRVRALNERALAMTAAFGLTTEALRQRVAAAARQLEVREPAIADLRRYGEEHGMHISVARLDSLG